METLYILLLPLALIVIASWGLSFYFDTKRIESYIQENGDQALSINWQPFGHGWFSEGSADGGNRIYFVQYKDVYGNVHEVWCKTAMLSGVFFSQDKIISHATPSGEPMTADEKVAILEAELKKAREQH